MSKIFGYANTGGNDWFKVDAYSDKEIEAIKDPEGGGEISMPTAIPSPFARIDLVKTAFRNIAKSQDLKSCNKNGNVIASKNDEKLVSDCLDIAEMLFNYDNISDKVKIIVWERSAELTKLKAQNDMQRRLAETFELYLDQDKESYNFNLLQRLFLIEYNHKIIGCTSPATLFFTTANDLKHAQISLTNNDILFDDKYSALYERDKEFQKYFYLLVKANPVLYSKMKHVVEYLEKYLKILNEINPKFYDELNRLDKSSYVSNYTELNTGNSGELIDVIGVPLRKRKKENILEAIASSDFIIQSSKIVVGPRPLVLQNNLTKQFVYINENWDKTAIKVPFYESETNLEKRWLPGIRIQYPYLTVSDFLEPYLIRLVYPINKNKFFDGNVNTDIGDDSKGFILPLKKQFFDYFTVDDLLSSIQGKPQIELIQGLANSVKVILHIPVAKKNEYISFERIYMASDDLLAKPDEENNKGVIVEHQFGITLFPFIKTNDPEIKCFYRIQLIDRDIAGELKNSEYDIKFYSNKYEVESKIKQRSNKKEHTASSKYFVINQEFDFLQIKSRIASGIIIPKWRPFHHGNKQFKFAIDFGTTNTHIEYFDNKNENIRPFDITIDEEIQIATLFDNIKTSEDFGGSGAIAIREMIEEEFLPFNIGSVDSQYKFPQRTVLAESGNIDINSNTETLADFNIPFIFEKRLFRYNNTFHTNLKWAKQEQGNQKRIKSYFEKLIFIIRNKILLNQGNLRSTEIVWFYPTSMKSGRIDDLEKLWKSLINEYINPERPPKGIPESLAPFYYYKYQKGIPGGNSTPAVSIDIGGGTTDVVYFLKNKPLLLTSFKFAANTIFGDGFSPIANKDKGIANKYTPFFEKVLNSNGYQGLLKGVLRSLRDRKSEDINTFLFSLEENINITDKDSFSYNQLLNNDEDLKIIFLYFYCAIIFHVSDLINVKLKGMAMPNHILFSGNGSKILNIISTKTSRLNKISQIIFEKVFEKSYGSQSLEIVREAVMSKETTCKGGLLVNSSNDLEINDVREIKTIMTYEDSEAVLPLSYDQIDEKVKNNIINRVKIFNTLFLDLIKSPGFSEDFKVSPNSIRIFETEANRHLLEYLEDGILYNQKLDKDFADKKVEETLFFLPLIGVIKNLSILLSDLTPV